MTTLLQLEGFVTEATKHMISKFEGFAQTGIKVNMQEWAQYVSPGERVLVMWLTTWYRYWAFDVIGLITVSARMDSILFVNCFD